MGPERHDEQQESAGFTVHDRRRFNPDGTPRTEPEAPPTPEDDPPGSPESAPGPAASPPPPPRQSGGHAAADIVPPADFSGLILSLAQTAMIDLGAAPHPDTGEVQRDLRLARHSIDMISMLREKTQGNLTTEESRLLDGVLYQLRLAFVEAQKAGSP